MVGADSTAAPPDCKRWRYFFFVLHFKPVLAFYCIPFRINAPLHYCSNTIFIGVLTMLPNDVSIYAVNGVTI